MYDSILVPTDGSDHSLRAAQHGAYLAGAFDATLHLLYAVDVQAAAGPFNAGGVDEEFIDRLEADGQDAIDAATSAIGAPDRVRTALVRGQPSGEILDYVAERDIDLVAMGTHGRTGVNRYIAGSVTERVVRLSAVPVLTVRATDTNYLDGDPDEILVPTDGSGPATDAADHGIAIAERTGARVHAVNVVDVRAVGSAVGDGSDRASVGALRTALEDDGRRAVETVASRAEEAGVDVVTEIGEGAPAKTLLAYAAEEGIDLIAMGTQGRTGLQRYLLGSTAERLIRRAKRPVLAVSSADGPPE